MSIQFTLYSFSTQFLCYSRKLRPSLINWRPLKMCLCFTLYSKHSAKFYNILSIYLCILNISLGAPIIIYFVPIAKWIRTHAESISVSDSANSTKTSSTTICVCSTHPISARVGITRVFYNIQRLEMLICNKEGHDECITMCCRLQRFVFQNSGVNSKLIDNL